MKDKEQLFILKKSAVPEVLLKVVEAKRLIDSEKVMTIGEAVDEVGISRSSFYKYRDDIYPFLENTRGKTINIMLQVDDKPGLLAIILKEIALGKANILTINQSIPTGGIAAITLGIELRPESRELTEMIAQIEEIDGVNSLKILGQDKM